MATNVSLRAICFESPVEIFSRETKTVHARRIHMIVRE